MHLAPNYLHRRFAQAFGLTPFAYMQNKKLQRIRQLLLTTNLTLGQIAGKSGFECEFYMSRVFKKHFGMSPSQWRKRHEP